MYLYINEEGIIFIVENPPTEIDIARVADDFIRIIDIKNMKELDDFGTWVELPKGKLYNCELGDYHSI